jgi:hypothetical protein
MISSIQITADQGANGSLREWSTFLHTLTRNKVSGKPLLKKAEVPERLLRHLENRLFTDPRLA